MLLNYIRSAMRRARYEVIVDGEGFYGEIPGRQEVFASEDTLEPCREQLAEVLKDWILLRISRNLDISVL